jgi:hypothetical protein
VESYTKEIGWLLTSSPAVNDRASAIQV